MMLPDLGSLLGFSTEKIEKGDFILLSDRNADASFLINHFLSLYLRAGCKVCFLGLVQSFSHYSAVALRLGVNLVQAREQGQLVFLEGLKDSVSQLLQQGPNSEACPMGFLRGSQTDLRSLFRFVQRSVGGAGEWSPSILLVDDMSVLLSLGVSVGAILDFSHYCRTTVCHQLQGNMVMLVRVGEEEDDEEGPELLLKALTHQCSLALSVQGLPTGYCRDIHGQVEVRWKERGAGPGGALTQKKLLQYKVHDKGVSFFARGTSSAVL
ncbi:elongator complex protein 6-like isoform X1 [Brienomyrus brachyistius]|uniref:elongator complex protein 6-like isoform X1 n=1 Tax=Brienomyrus brachyistius TaxID=42636 RepID=UPI0020B2CCCD|nr:elongator complex protein 6-like isoform X1 [Brienomyrus brachyistius]XP_048880470.1 elongator complex protein 6-like isoform X1 [Brienomyrus brachyistius]